MQAHRSAQHTQKITPRNQEGEAHRSINPQGQSETEAHGSTHKGLRQNSFRYTLLPQGSLGALGDTPIGDRGSSAPGALSAPPGARRPDRACLCVRACPPARARHHLWEDRCALRPRLRAARWGERLPWRAERGRILMGGHGHCPHSGPPLATLSSHSFLQLSSSLGRAPSAHALLSDPEPLVPGRYRLIFPPLRSIQAQ